MLHSTMKWTHCAPPAPVPLHAIGRVGSRRRDVVRAELRGKAQWPKWSAGPSGANEKQEASNRQRVAQQGGARAPVRVILRSCRSRSRALESSVGAPAALANSAILQAAQYLMRSVPLNGWVSPADARRKTRAQTDADNHVRDNRRLKAVIVPGRRMPQPRACEARSPSGLRRVVACCLATFARLPVKPTAIAGRHSPCPAIGEPNPLYPQQAPAHPKSAAACPQWPNPHSQTH